MRVDDARVRLNGTLPWRGDGARAAGVTAQASASDRVELSMTARMLAGLRDAMGSLDDLREERVAGLRPVVGTGRYRVETERVARSLLVEELGGLVA